MRIRFGFFNGMVFWTCWLIQILPSLGQSLSRDLYNNLWVNQVGYRPFAPKHAVTRGVKAQSFQVVEITTGTVVYEGIFQPNSGDFGDHLVADFSAVKEPGHYYVTSDTLRSFPFVVADQPYQKAMDLIVQYFSLQRCGPSTTGYLSPCHLDDGVRLDNGKHQDVTGGWHDASDLRKWVGATLYGMIGLSKAYEFEKDQGKRDAILEELRWGNQYFLKMQEPDGYVMGFIGGEIQQAGDNNRWTDNKIGSEGGEMGLENPKAGESTHQMMVFGSKDDRIIQTVPLDMIGQYTFVTSEAFMARITKNSDIDYSEKCLKAAIRAFDWSTKSMQNPSPGVLGTAIQASLELYRTTGGELYKNYAVQLASQLIELQAETAPNDSFGGYFYTSSARNEPYKNIWNGCLELISVCDLIQAFPEHTEAASWREMVAGYTGQYLSLMAKRNSFGIIPFGLYQGQDPGGNRRMGKYWYRYFMVPEDWWVGINANIASMGVGLMKASRVLNDQQLESLAQRQLDWIIGSNPFNSSTIVGVGFNQPAQFVNGFEFRPETPVIPGAVMNGLGGDFDDRPAIGNGHYHVSEYWTPMVGYTLWLMTELSRSERGQ